MKWIQDDNLSAQDTHVKIKTNKDASEGQTQTRHHASQLELTDKEWEAYIMQYDRRGNACTRCSYAKQATKESLDCRRQKHQHKHRRKEIQHVHLQTMLQACE